MPHRPRRPDESLEDYLKSAPKGEWIELPSVNTLTKDEYLLLIGDVSPSRITSLHNSAASNRDLVVETLGLFDIAATRLLRTSLVVAFADALLGREGKPGKLRDLELKMHLCLALGLISATEHKELDSLRWIRNAFGHDPNLHYFEHNASVVEKCRSLTPGFDSSPMAGEWRTRFYVAAVRAMVSLEKRLSAAAARTPPSELP